MKLVQLELKGAISLAITVTQALAGIWPRKLPVVECRKFDSEPASGLQVVLLIT